MESVEVYQNNISDKTLIDFIDANKIKLSQDQLKLYLEIARINNLNPFKKEVYVVNFGNQFNIITSYIVYIKRAEQSGLLDGWKVEKTESGAKVTIYRKDFKHPFEWEVENREFNKGTGTWKTMPDFMIKKVAIAQAFRLCFSDSLAGLPYIKEEIEENPHIESIINEMKPVVEIEPIKISKKTISKEQQQELIELVNNDYANKDKRAKRLEKIASNKILQSEFNKIKEDLFQEILLNSQSKSIQELRADAISHIKTINEDSTRLVEIANILQCEDEMFFKKQDLFDLVMKVEDKETLQTIIES